MCAAWGSSTSADALLDRIQRRELTHATVLPTKKFGDVQIMRLVEILDSDPQNPLRSLSASGHKVSESALLVLGEACSKSRMEALAVGDSTLGNNGTKSLLRGLSKHANNNHLISLDLSYKGITDVLGILADIAVSCPNLTTLELSHNHSTVLATSFRLEKLSNVPCFTKLESVNLSDCNLNALAVETMMATWFSKTPLKTLNLSHNPIRDVGTARIGNLVEIQSLNLSHCQLTDSFIGHWNNQQSTTTNSGVLQESCQKMDLSHNAISDMQTLAAFLGNCHLQELNLAGNPIFPGTVDFLSNLEIQSLDLSGSNCGVEDAWTCLKIEGLRSLRLFQNNLGNAGFHTLASLCASYSISMTLEILDLAGNQAEPDAVNDFLQTLFLCKTALPSLSTLIIGGNKCNNDTEQIIRQIQTVRPLLDIARDKF
jgi:Ran GTPase-activating protein (RanGAP) involved in mRNA processing and transport